ncbi:MAG TPA: 9-O-acetylesterase, partial [Phycisphaerae bacterium]|nr:9-O-acetylesterase [Phycisphaerae bacterium]
MRIRCIAAASVMAFSAVSAVRGDVTPNPLFSDHMVLQQAKPIPVWGMAASGEQVTVTLGAAKQVATAGADGNWAVKLPEQKAGAG